MSKNELEIDRLKAVDKELAQADAEFEHQQRRYNDQMERNGGHDWGFGEDLKRIIQNRQSIAKERAEIYSVHVRTRKSLGDMMRKLSDTSSHRSPQFLGTSSFKKPSIAVQNSLNVA